MPRSTRAKKKKSTPGKATPSKKSARTSIDPTPPVHRLALESLAHIFLYLAPRFILRGETIFTSYRPSSEKASDFTLVMLVCRRWRMAAISSPSLWTYTDATNIKLDALETRLRRSGVLPLAICVHMEKTTSRVLKALAQETERIRCLQISLGDGHGPKLYTKSLSAAEKAFHKPAPILEEFYLFADGGHGHELRKVEAVYPLPTLFSGQYPCLQVLSLEHIDTWPRNTFKNLTALHLATGSNSSSTLRSVLELLRASPNIKDVSLQSEIIRADGLKVATKRDRIHLSHLRRLSFEAECPDVRIFLSYLDIPESVHLIISATYQESDLDGFKSPLDCMFPTHSSARESFELANQLTIIYDARELAICVDATSSSLTSVHIKVQVVKIHMPDPDAEFRRVLLDVSESFPLSNIKALNVTAIKDSHRPSDRGQALWHNVLKYMRSIEELTVENNAYADIFRALRPIPIDLSNSSFYLCPELREIQFNATRILSETMLEVHALVESRRYIDAVCLHRVWLVQDDPSDTEAENDLDSLKVCQKLIESLDIECIL